MNSFARQIVDNEWVQLIYYSVLMVLVAIIFYHVHVMSSENYIGQGLAYSTGAITSGATQRFGTGFTSTDQGATPSFNDLQGREYLTSSREPPVFWDISNLLAEYQYATQYNCADGSPPMPMKDNLGNTYFACTDGSTPTDNNGRPVTGPAKAASPKSAAEYMTAVTHQDEVLRNHLY